MSRMIFVNLPVKDLSASRGFFTALGFEFDEQFSDGKAACVALAGRGRRRSRAIAATVLARLYALRRGRRCREPHDEAVGGCYAGGDRRELQVPVRDVQDDQAVRVIFFR